MKKILVFVCMALFFPNSFLLAQPHGQFEQGKEKRIIHLLKLTDEQQKKFADISSQFKKEIVDVRSKIKKNRIDLKKMIDGGALDEKLLVQLTEENSKLQGDIKSLAVKRWLEVNKMLDKDQKETWMKILSKVTSPGMMQERMKGRMKNFMNNKHPMRDKNYQ